MICPSHQQLLRTTDRGVVRKLSCLAGNTGLFTACAQQIFAPKYCDVSHSHGLVRECNVSDGQGRSQKFILGGYNLLLHDTTVLYTSSLTTTAASSAQNNFQGLILGGYIYRYTPPRRYAPGDG